MSMISLNKQLKDLLARTTQLESATGAQHLANSLLEFNMLGVVYTAPACLATIPFFNGIPIGYELMQALVSQTIGRIYSQISMELAALLDVESIMSGLMDEAVNSAEDLINSKINEATNQINQYTQEVEGLIDDATNYASQISDWNAEISDLEASLVGETEQAVIDSINAEIGSLQSQIEETTGLMDAANEQINGLQTYVLDNLQNNVLNNLQAQLLNSIGLDITSIFETQTKLSKQFSNMLTITAPWKE